MDLRQQQNIAIYSKIHEDIEKIKKEIYGKKTNQMDRKLWKYKYGKSVGQKLITYIQQQQPMLESPLPAHARPKLQRNVPEKNVSKYP